VIRAAKKILSYWLGIEVLNVKRLFPVEAANAAEPVFPQSVASRPAKPNGIVLWTRITIPGDTASTARVAFEISNSGHLVR